MGCHPGKFPKMFKRGGEVRGNFMQTTSDDLLQVDMSEFSEKLAHPSCQSAANVEVGGLKTHTIKVYLMA